MSSEGLDVLLSFHLAQANLANVLNTLKLIRGISALLTVVTVCVGTSTVCCVAVTNGMHITPKHFLLLALCLAIIFVVSSLKKLCESIDN